MTASHAASGECNRVRKEKFGFQEVKHPPQRHKDTEKIENLKCRRKQSSPHCHSLHFELAFSVPLCLCGGCFLAALQLLHLAPDFGVDEDALAIREAATIGHALARRHHPLAGLERVGGIQVFEQAIDDGAA